LRIYFAMSERASDKNKMCFHFPKHTEQSNFSYQYACLPNNQLHNSQLILNLSQPMDSL
jgi:hypothetical protein